MEYEGYKLKIVLGKYYNGNRAIQLYTDDGEPFVTLTVNICELPTDEACIDINNFPDGIELIRKYELGVFTGNYVYSGFCSYPVFYLNMDNVKKYLN